MRTFTTPELVATKIRALYQRKKGRDLFDLWLALTDLRFDPNDILTAFTPYRPVGLTAKNAAANLRAQLDDAEFCADLDLLVNTSPTATTSPSLPTSSSTDCTPGSTALASRVTLLGCRMVEYVFVHSGQFFRCRVSGSNLVVGDHVGVHPQAAYRSYREGTLPCLRCGSGRGRSW